MIRRLSDFLTGGYRNLPPPIWAIFGIQVILRGGDFVFPFLTLFLTRKLGLSGMEAGFWIAANVASGLAGVLVSGKVSDHLGRRNVLAVCMIGVGLLTGVCGFLPPSLLVPRILVVAAFFQGSMRPILAACIMDMAPPALRKEAFSLSYLGVNLGISVGPMAAGFLFETHPSWVFFGTAGAQSCALALLLKRVPELHATSGHGSERAAAGGSIRAILGRPILLAFGVITFFLSFAYAQTNFGLTLYTARFFGPRGATLFGFLMSLNAFVVLGSTAVLTRLTRHLSAPVTMGLGSALMAAGFGMMAFPLGRGLLAVSTLVWTLGEVLHATNVGAYLASHTPSNFRGRFQSFRELAGSGGRLASPMVFGAIITGLGLHVSWAVTGLVTLGCAAGFAGLHCWEKSSRAVLPGAGTDL